MDVFTFTLTVFVSFLGILFGTLLTHYTKDEVLDMRRAIPFMQFGILVLVFLILFFYFPFGIMSAFLVMSFGFIYLFWKKNNLNVLDYIVLSMVLVISSLNPQAHLYITLCAFVFGILSGALFYVMNSQQKKKKHRKIAHHRHTGKNLSLNAMTTQLFFTYKFFFILAIIAFVSANLIQFVW